MAFVSKNENFKETFVYFNVKNQIKFALKYTNVRYATEKADTPGPAYNLICFENIGAGIVIQGPLLIGVIGKLDAGRIAVEEDVLVPKLEMVEQNAPTIAIPAYKRADEILAIELLTNGQARSERGRRWSGGSSKKTATEWKGES